MVSWSVFRTAWLILWLGMEKVWYVKVRILTGLSQRAGSGWKGG